MLLSNAKSPGDLEAPRLPQTTVGGVGSIKSSKLLTKEREYELAYKALAGDIDARNELVNANYGLVAKLAGQYAGPGAPFEDLFQEGCIGLVIAAGKFNPEKNCRFSTYATLWIKKYICRSSFRSGFSTTIPRRLEPYINKVLSFSKAFELTHGREPSPEEVSCDTNIPCDVVRDALRFSKPWVEYDDHHGSEDHGHTQNSSKENEDAVISLLMKKELNAILERVLTEKERFVVNSLFSEDTRTSKKQLSMLLHISVSQVSCIESQAFQKIKEYFNTNNIDYRDFLTEPD